MRVIGGSHKGRRLRTIAGLEVRPTSDRLRETLFNILAPTVGGARFLDICAGSGAVGIEALSRGASHATFIDRSRRAAAAIASNLAALGITEGFELINRDAQAALKHLAESLKKFDIAFFDPPYASEIYPRVMAQLAEQSLVEAAGIVIVEHRAKRPPGEAFGSFRLYRVVKQGESALAFYGRI
ncbi:MAG TPA: 16S rRNA (guanine(966)-N(2))-methyltransferase RsmD [Blastocatellia bacterium]|nr:16S rRNA (guanine(966)-N(2))-methyltransferase RsmD [Blastocatellia bacterium]